MTDNIIYDPNNPAMKKAFILTAELSMHCKIHNLPRKFILNGVAFDVYAVIEDEREKGYLEGKAYEKGRITELLGLNNK